MGAPLPWMAVAAVVTLVNGGTLGYVAGRERDASLRLWAWAWVAWAFAVLPLMVLGDAAEAPHPLAAVACGLLWVASTLCFLAGTYQLSKRPMPRLWYAVAAGCAATALALGIGPAGTLGMVPLVLFQCVGQFATGALILREAKGRAGAWLAGGSLIGLALHVLDAPLTMSHPALVPWGFVVATALELCTALGMLALHYERARAELAETQRVLEQTRRIEALGRVAGGVAHDFNNMLAVMQGNLDLLRMGASATPARPELDEMQDAIRQASRLTSQLLAFGRRAPIQAETIDLGRVVAGTIELLRKVVPKGVELSFRSGEGSLEASMDRALLEQIVLNLVTNARDAIDGNGHIRVALDRVDTPAPAARLRVEDDGAGMDEAVVSRIFEPFFTTKPEGHGTGLGLASVQGSVTQLGGTIQVASRPGQGTTFEVLLPLARASTAS
jgi:signal transduction histidine kinase